MNRIVIFICGFIVLVAASSVFAQWGGTPGRGRLPLSDSPCWTKPYLEGTPEQLKSLEDLQRSFFKEVAALRSPYITQRYELHALLDSPRPDAGMILEKQRRLSELQRKIDERSLQYLLKARAVFTPDQLSRLPSGCNLGFHSGLGAGWGRGMGKSNRF